MLVVSRGARIPPPTHKPVDFPYGSGSEEKVLSKETVRKPDFSLLRSESLGNKLQRELFFVLRKSGVGGGAQI